MNSNTKWANIVGKMVSIDLLNIVLPQTFNLFFFFFKKSTIAVKHKGKCKKTRSACRGRRHSAASQDRSPLSYQLALRKPESARDSGFTGLRLLGHGCPHCVSLEGTAWSCVSYSTATTSVRRMGASSLAFLPGLCSLGDLRDRWAHLIKLHSHPGELQKQWGQNGHF